jgi:Protein of unknown function (DUF4239)
VGEAFAGAVTRTVLKLPEALLELLFIGTAVLCSVALHALLQRRLHTEVLRRHNDVAGYLFSAVGVLYAVVLGFVVVVVWQKYDSTVSNVEAEVSATGDLYHAVAAFPVALRTQVRSDLRAYVQNVINIEWPAMEAGRDLPLSGATLLEDAAYRIDTFASTSFQQLAAQQAAMSDMQRLFDARRQRLIQTVPAVPSVLWFALVVGALAMVAFCYIFGVENRPAQLVMTAILVGLIGILFVVIGEFSGPFSGSVSISSDGWQYLAQRLQYIR